MITKIQNFQLTGDVAQLSDLNPARRIIISQLSVRGFGLMLSQHVLVLNFDTTLLKTILQSFLVRHEIAGAIVRADLNQQGFKTFVYFKKSKGRCKKWWKSLLPISALSTSFLMNWT